jgi:hypothetical protein
VEVAVKLFINGKRFDAVDAEEVAEPLGNNIECVGGR